MADPVQPLRLGTIVWFGSLEFISLGHEYDMVLLPPRASSTDDDATHQQPARRRRSGQRSRCNRQARCVRDRLNITQDQGDAPRTAGFPHPAVGTESLAGDLSSLSLGERETPAARSTNSLVG